MNKNIDVLIANVGLVCCCGISHGSTAGDMLMDFSMDSPHEIGVYSFVYTNHDGDNLTRKEQNECADYSARLSRIDSLCDRLIENPSDGWTNAELERTVLSLSRLAPSGECHEQIILWISKLNNESTQMVYSKLVKIIESN
jgi:hypothetical protein